MNTFHQDVWKMETMESQSERQWLAWIDEAERLAGHDLDGDGYIDGYSIDDAYDAWRNMETPQQYVNSIK